MSDLLRESINGAHPPHHRPRPSAISISEADEYSSSDSSTSSIDSTASVNTVRPSSMEHEAPPTHWTNFFAQELYLDHQSESEVARYHVYLTPPADIKKGPLFVCHHGAGVSGMSFALFWQYVQRRLPEAGILSLEARAHGSSVTNSSSGEAIVDFSLRTLAADALTMVKLTQSRMSWPQLPPIVLVGHSLGGAVVTQLAFDYAFGNALIGYSVIDVVEGSATEALGHMNAFLSSRPSSFGSIDDAIAWHIRSRTLRNPESARISVPSLFEQAPSGRYIWKTDLTFTRTWWEDWFSGMSQKFLKGRGAKELILAGTDRLDKDLMIGQMQGKFQLVVLPEAGHFVQEDIPERTAQLLVDFFKRNDRSALVLPPKVSDLLAQGKKV